MDAKWRDQANISVISQMEILRVAVGVELPKVSCPPVGKLPGSRQIRLPTAASGGFAIRRRLPACATRLFELVTLVRMLALPDGWTA
jgi:hypothetical protein